MMRAAFLAMIMAVFAASELVAQERFIVLTEPGTPVVAAEILVMVGPAQEESGRGGISYLAARSVLAQVQPALDSIGASASVMPHKDAISISVIAAPDVWESATRRVALALFRDPLQNAPFTAQRRAIATELRGRLANPADAITRETDQAFFGSAHPWGRPTVGTPESVERLTLAQVDAHLRDHFVPERALVAVVGPVETSEALLHLRPLFGAARSAPIQVTAFRSAERPVRREYDSITTWIAASYRFPDTGDVEALRFLTYLAADALSFSPAQRSVFDVSSEVVERVGTGEIRLQIVVPPEEASEWAERLEATIPSIAARPLLDDFLEGHLRRFRGQRLMSLLSPEDRAREAARQLFVHGRFLGFSPDIAELTQERVRAAARSLGSPTLVLLGPTLEGD